MQNAITRQKIKNWIMTVITHHSLHAKFTTRIICILRNSAYVFFKLILKLSDEFVIMLST